MTAKTPNFTKLAWRETLSEVKLTSPVAMILTLGSAATTIAVTYVMTRSVAISAICSLALLAAMIVVLFLWKLISLPRRLLAEEMQKTDQLTRAANTASASPPAPHDMELFRKFTLLITDNDVNFFGGHHFGDDIPKSRLVSAREFYSIWDKPQYEFVAPDMNARFDEVKASVADLCNAIMKNTMTNRLRPDCLTVRHDGDPYGESDRTKEETKEMNAAATRFVETVKAFHRFALERGFLFG
ncbi:hypothetical protein [Asticcacaulis sp. W401b]|uniref:hypothetical protein n=1 Tax=Asticcacaulis sp. W401b TaxID=3388666 RepID=UPI0039705EF8